MPAPGAATQASSRRASFVLFFEKWADVEVNVGAVETPHHDLRLPHAQTLDDLAPHRGRRSSRERENRGVTQRLDHGGKQQIVGAEIVPPPADAMSLVDDEQRRPGFGQRGDDVVLLQLLWREEEELGVAGTDLFERRPPRRDADRRVGRHRRTGSGHVDEVGDLVTLEGDERRHDDGRTIEEQSGQLVDG